jgi:hypothetical protein
MHPAYTTESLLGCTRNPKWIMFGTHASEHGLWYLMNIVLTIPMTKTLTRGTRTSINLAAHLWPEATSPPQSCCPQSLVFLMKRRN